jgi:hypothetical protein
MQSYESGQKIYVRIDRLAEKLRELESVELADKLNFMIHKVSWTSSSELFSELLNILESVLNNVSSMPEIENEVQEIVREIHEKNLC